YPLHPGQTSPEPYYVTVPLEEYEGLKDRILQMQNKVLQLEGEKILLEHKAKELSDIIIAKDAEKESMEKELEDEIEKKRRDNMILLGIISKAGEEIKRKDIALCTLRAWAWCNHDVIGIKIKRYFLYWVNKSKKLREALKTDE
ncbi:MAG: hypothetical protein HUK20_05995, partial [Fibrobacter sp.]|nr:hypothetical protein [Fibrobacter sp.]